MQRFLQRLGGTLMTAVMFVFTVSAQEVPDTTKPTSIDPKLIEWQNARIVKEYTIAEVNITGIRYLDTSIVYSIANLQPGDKFVHPGADVFGKAISNLWRQKLFSNVQIYVTRIDGDKVWLEINLQERPRLGSYKFVGIKKSEEEDILGKITLTKQTIITENTRRELTEKITGHFSEKGYRNVKVKIEESPDPAFVNSNVLTIIVDKGGKVRINEVGFYGNENIEDLRLKKQLKGTKEMSKLTFYPDKATSPYGENKPFSFNQYMRDWGFLSLSKTKMLLDPYFRFKLFSGAKFDAKKYEEDKEKILDYYNSMGYRDAQIVADTQYTTANGNLNVDLKVDEGRRYYFGNINWKGNAKYSDSVLNVILGINKGDIYNVAILNKRLGKEASQDGGDISGLYMDEGYLFFRAEPIETAVYNDTIDYEIRIMEGPQARIKNVTIAGNEKTKDYVIRRELRTIPGELFSRSDLIRSQRELGNLQYFNQETINPGVVPNAEDGTVDINWKLEEKSSDQLELSAGWGGGIGLTGTLGVTFNNFSIRNIWKKSAWDPLPTGDGQKLSLRMQSNGRAYRSYSASFTEPWLGGKKRNSLTIGFNNSKYSNAFDPFTGQIDRARSDSNFLKTTGVSVSLGKQLKWPDDYFSLVYTFNVTQYKLRNYPIFDQNFTNGTSNNVSFKIGLQRSSVFNPIFPTSGSNFLASVQFTPPYSLFNKNIAKSDNKYKNPEYHKWRFNAEWYVPIGKPLGAEKNRQFVLKMAAKYGFMGRYNKDLDYSPFERFQVGDAGLTNNFGLLGYDIIAHRGYPVYQSSDPTVNPDQQSASQFFTIFNKYQLEMRFPLVTNPSSTIYALTFFEAANGWYNYKDYNPFRLRRSVGVGMRFFLPMFGLLGFDYGVGLDRIQPGQSGLKGASRFTFMLGFEPD
ncbi:MAG: outer membrane protein assembly factor [Chitinophagaceae bacterium]|nr:outer membrane protein assembly factor [Chitinophagaceae bacterium]MBL0306648.1 outer membrane protein assembly factor [Chitinophagaceae bacterium]HQV61910.1 POTRA domain-containing protein [Chitinophagaceae bacterium]HQV85959.1 POTRA domain-containing protein [Chitinophagaceae bacterium]HQX73294.1 POTRA domain-containing protein [Chitinophagaceae bacterium]